MKELDAFNLVVAQPLSDGPGYSTMRLVKFDVLFLSLRQDVLVKQWLLFGVGNIGPVNLSIARRTSQASFMQVLQ